jgi:hypothetical protein
MGIGDHHSLADFVWPLFKIKQTSTYICRSAENGQIEAFKLDGVVSE